MNRSALFVPTSPATDERNDNILVRWHVGAITAHLVSGALGAAVVARYDPHVPVVASLVSFGANGATAAYMSAKPKTLFWTSALWPLVAVEFITAFFHVLYILQLKSPDFKLFVRRFAQTSSLNALRWYEYGITATLMISFGSVVVGANDFYFFLKLVTNGIALQCIGYCIELLDRTPTSERIFNILFYAVGLNLNLINVAVLMTQVFASDTGSAKQYYAVNALPMTFWFQTFGLLASMAYKKTRIFANPYIVEEWYIILSLSTKITVFWVAFGTFRKVLEDNGAPRLGVDWDAVRYTAFVAPFVLVFVCAMRYRRAWFSKQNV